MITLRLDTDLEKTINKTAKSIGISKSELIRKSVTEYIKKIRHKNPWELGKDLFAKYSSGKNDLSENASTRFKAKLKNKRK